ncbi:MAG: porphobilinogen synthase, partial [Anaerolineae bacterium]
MMNHALATFPNMRMRRLRSQEKIRDLIRETHLCVSDFVLPLFIREAAGDRKPIASMPGHFQITLDHLAEEIDEILSLHIPAVLLFGIPENKDERGSKSYLEHGIVQRAIRIIKKRAPSLLVISDLCFCEYTDHGHCGVLKKTEEGGFDVDNDATLELLVKQALSHARAGSDLLAP